MSDQPKRLPLMAWVVTFIISSVLIVGAAMLFRHAERRTSDPMPPIATVPDFSFTTQDGKTFTKADLLGKVWVADFIFTRCPGPCPIMSARMAEVSHELSKADDVRLVSFTIDPDHDTSAVLKDYANRMMADQKHWIFLTGSKQEITEFTTHGMLQALAVDPTGLPTHSTRFLLVDRAGQIRNTRNLDEPELVQKLLMDIGGLLRENPFSKVAQPNATP